ncbi:MAG: hypothetical protein COW48_07510 [Hydrogenophilales bacterium CG17_big_fil_post_rev_8_21_14_2_50_63_12]|nr:MAG: hypothetical protein COW48_07510 [Hydrogenophilales bacterium CG17_big_fil_post_rev_8_21_14_2_50_63_12]PIX97356.1 MAG: hypothetical protein COZ24_05680 [Hydrogenophilales bacterium CG_4_10_14_3_um_filter_63_21]PJB07635.1 MAG: hypothetical protein CO126_00660 [Hydrogenophilales bacterium CG_4_9_14_3_um_filter_63_34]
MLPVTFGTTLFPEITIRANPDFKPDGPQHLVDAHLNSALNTQAIEGEDNQFFSELRVKLDPGSKANVPYYFDILCLLTLTISPEVPNEHRLSLANQAAHTIAFPAVRELILNLTARQPWGQFFIGLSVLTPQAVKETEPTAVPGKARIVAKSVRKPRKKAAAAA